MKIFGLQSIYYIFNFIYLTLSRKKPSLSRKKISKENNKIKILLVWLNSNNNGNS